jgi:DNA uptake protein ComE-like DNA-binding protein
MKRPSDRDHNSASFEDLRGLGLSVNQAARVIAQRDQRGGFASVENLDTLNGVPREVIEQPKRATR